MAEATGESIATCLRLSKALSMARQGKLREAQQLLAAEGTLPESALELHALAALATGEGDYPRAQRLWRLLLQREPGHAEAKRMIDSIELWMSRPAWFSYIPIGLMVTGAGLVFALLAWVLSDEPAPAPKLAPRPATYSAPASAQPPAPVPAFTLPNMAPPRPVDPRKSQNR